MAIAPKTQTIMSNLEYDWLTVMHHKAQALQAYDQYLQDARDADSQDCVELLTRLKQTEAEQIQEIRQHLRQVMPQG